MLSRTCASRLGALLLFSALAVSPVHSEVIVVDCSGGGDYVTLQEGIDAASRGDTVLVAPCTYTGGQNRDLDFGGKSIELRSMSGSGSTIIDCENAGRGFYFHSGEDALCIVEGFTIENGWHYSQGGGIMCFGSSPAIHACVVVNCSSDDGGGLLCDQGASPHLVNCEFVSCSAAFGGGIFCEQSSPGLFNCTFSENQASASGGGVFCHEGSYPVFDACSFVANHADDGGGMLVYGGLPTITDCVFTGNTAAFGGAFFCELPSPTLERCTFVDNHATGRGGGMFFQLGTMPSIIDCTLAANGASQGGGIFGYESDPVIERTIIAFGTSGAAVECDGGGQPSLVCSDVFGNVGGDWAGCIGGQNGVTGNISEDPLFCGEANPEFPYSLDAASPCLGACGTMGAWDEGCGASVVESVSWGHLKALFRTR